MPLLSSAVPFTKYQLIRSLSLLLTAESLMIKNQLIEIFCSRMDGECLWCNCFDLIWFVVILNVLAWIQTSDLPDKAVIDMFPKHSNLITVIPVKVKLQFTSTGSFNSLGPSEAIWWWRFWSTLVQVMACCLTAPSHYLNQCWLIISKGMCHSSEDIIIRKFEDTNQ